MNTITTRFAALVVIAAIAASACSSGEPSATDGPVFDPAASTNPSPTSTTTEPRPAATLPPTPAIELIAVTIHEIGVTSVVPRGWTDTPDGAFTGQHGLLGFAAIPSSSATDPTEDGFALLEGLQVGGRTWDLYILEASELTVVLAITEIGDMTYLVGLEAPPHLADQYTASVAMPALEAFKVAASGPTNVEIELATITIDGRAIAYATGGSGPTTVVFEAGLGNGMESWSFVAPEVAAFARIFAYDRPGYRGSDPTETPRDAATIVAELRQLLLATGHEPPYILVGHSLGGTVMDLYARTHSDEVAGLVLVDSRHHEFTARCLAQLDENECDILTDEEVDSAPPPIGEEWRALSLTVRQLEAAPGLNQLMPLVVIVAGLSESTPRYNELWQATQRDYAALVPGSRLIVADNSDHGIPAQQPAVIIDAIAELLRDND